MTTAQITIDTSPYQEQIFTFEGVTVRLTLRYIPTTDVWEADLYNETDREPIIYGLPLVCGVPLLERRNIPFFLWVEDTSGFELDPTGGSDLGRRCILYIESKSDETIRA